MRTREYPEPAMTGAVVRQGNPEETDLLQLAATLWRGWRYLLGGLVAGTLLAGAVWLVAPHTWTSHASVSVADARTWLAAEEMLVPLREEGARPEMNRQDALDRFVALFVSSDALQAWLATPEGARFALRGPGGLSRLLAGVKVRVPDCVADKHTSPDVCVTGRRTLQFATHRAADAQDALSAWTAYVVRQVRREMLDEVRATLALTLAQKTASLTLAGTQLDMEHQLQVRALGHALDIARAAGLVSPVTGMTGMVRDDPDYPVALGARGLARKLLILQGQTQTGADNVRYHTLAASVTRLRALSVPDMIFPVFRWQAHPDLPLKPDGLSLLAGLLAGGLLGAVSGAGGWLMMLALRARAGNAVLAPADDRITGQVVVHPAPRRTGAGVAQNITRSGS